MIEPVEATRESEEKEKAKRGQDQYKLWMDAIQIASKEEETWRKTAENAVLIYRQHDKRKESGETLTSRDRRFNILHANVETILPAIYNSTPIPDVRRRFGDPDKVAKEVCDLIERALAYSTDAYDFDDTIEFANKDNELTGRGVTRVRYMPYVADDELAYEEVLCEHVPWKHFRRGPGRVWSDVPWIAFELFLTRDQLVALAPKVGNKVNLDCAISGADDKKDGDNPPEIFKRARVWEIWDKDTRKVIFIAESHKEGPIREEDDPLGLTEFYPIPRPLTAIRTSDSLIPVVPYEIYKDQAEELERVSQRIMALTESLKARGVYDSRAKEIEQLADADDNTLIGIENVATFADGSKLQDKIHYWPLEVIIATLEKLYLARDQIKQTIYEITGIADILRGQTDPDETLGAQELKSEWGSLRIQKRQKDVERYARDLFDIKTEIIAKKFQWQTIQIMTGIQLPTAEQKQQLQAQIQQAQMQAQATGQPPQIPPEAAELLEKPTQEEVEQLLRSDLRGFRVDVESDSTVRGDLTKRQNNMNLFLQGTAQYAQAMGPIVMAPQFQSLMPAVMEIYAAFARNFKLGKQAEDALDSVADDAKKMAENPPPPQEDPSVQVEKLKAQNEQQKMQMEMAFKKEEHQMKLQMMQAELEKKRMELEMQREKMALDMQMHQQKMAMDAESMQREQMMAERQGAMEMERAEREHELGLEAGEQKHKMGLEALEAKTKAQKEAAKAKPKKKAA